MMCPRAVNLIEIWACEGADKVLEFINGATWTARIAKLAPDALIRVKVIGKLHGPHAQYPEV